MHTLVSTFEFAFWWLICLNSHTRFWFVCCCVFFFFLTVIWDVCHGSCLHRTFYCSRSDNEQWTMKPLSLLISQCSCLVSSSRIWFFFFMNMSNCPPCFRLWALPLDFTLTYCSIAIFVGSLIYPKVRSICNRSNFSNWKCVKLLLRLMKNYKRLQKKEQE